ncbi:MAG: hypothetical protein AVDCRST_MAG49-1971, partial [uncultured Thermomicrobiales bacterium]
ERVKRRRPRRRTEPRRRVGRGGSPRSGASRRARPGSRSARPLGRRALREQAAHARAGADGRADSEVPAPGRSARAVGVTPPISTLPPRTVVEEPSLFHGSSWPRRPCARV